MARTRMSAEQRREQIIAEALQLFAAQGLEGTRTRQIAQACGVSEGVLFHFFKSKSELQQACFEHELGRTFSAEQALDKDLETTLLRYAGLFLQENRERPAAFRFIMQTMLSQPEQSLQFHRSRGTSEYSGFIRNCLEQGRADGQLRAFDSEFAADVFIGSLFFISLMHEFFRPSKLNRMSVESQARTVVDLFINGLHQCAAEGAKDGGK
ncbi:TetR/AcrR family transcriptional regulator [bacterium]|nr:TetR/AcrR family transcriptional regulator [bacterium]